MTERVESARTKTEKYEHRLSVIFNGMTINLFENCKNRIKFFSVERIIIQFVLYAEKYTYKITVIIAYLFDYGSYFIRTNAAGLLLTDVAGVAFANIIRKSVIMNICYFKLSGSL